MGLRKHTSQTPRTWLQQCGGLPFPTWSNCDHWVSNVTVSARRSVEENMPETIQWGHLEGDHSSKRSMFYKRSNPTKIISSIPPICHFLSSRTPFKGIKSFFNNDILTGDTIHGIGLDLKLCQTQNVRGGDTVPWHVSTHTEDPKNRHSILLELIQYLTKYNT